jgi:hypothetical protein
MAVDFIQQEDRITHDELLEAIDFLPLDGLHAWMQPALRAVVELHKPENGRAAYCVACFMNTMDCPTIQTIEKELE